MSARARAAIPVFFLLYGAVMSGMAAREWPKIVAHHKGAAFEWPYACPSPDFVRFRPGSQARAEARMVAAGGWPLSRLPPDTAMAQGPMSNAQGVIVAPAALYLRDDVLPSPCREVLKVLTPGSIGVACLALAVALGRGGSRRALVRLLILCFGIAPVAPPVPRRWLLARLARLFCGLAVLMIPGATLSLCCDAPPLCYLGGPLLVLGFAVYFGSIAALFANGGWPTTAVGSASSWLKNRTRQSENRDDATA
jgi:hypothetical protein